MASLTSPRFVGSTTLTDCLNGVRTMPPKNGADPEPDKEAVELVQRALVDLGYLLSYDEVDGIFGSRTAGAVSRFKADRGISPSDGVVGRKTSKALDDEFPLGTLGQGLFAPFVAASRLDDAVAGLLDVLAGFFSLAWTGQAGSFAHQALTSQNLAGIARASRASDLKAFVPAAQHAEIDNVAATLAASSAANGPFAFTTRFEAGGVTRGYMIFQDALLDRASPGDGRHMGALLSLAHELTHFRNRVLDKTLRAEPVTATDYVDVAKANNFTALPGNTPTTDTRATFIAEVGVRLVAWRVYQELVVDHAGVMLATGVITRPAAVTELHTIVQRGQLFRSGIKFAADGAEPNHTYGDNGYMADLTFAPAATFNRQVAIWMRSASRMEFHDDAALANEVRTTLTTEIDAQSPAFATPNATPAGLIGA